MAALSHNKRMNVGLVYEMLIRELSSALLESDERTISLVTSVLERHFSAGSPLLAELDIHRIVLEKRGVSERVARRIIDEIKLAGAKLNKQSLELAKHKLIKEIDATIGTKLFSKHKVPEYKAHASINLLSQKGFERKLQEGIELAGVEDYLVAFLTSKQKPEQQVDAPAKLAYKIALEAYEDEYGKSLDSLQKELLSEHVRVKLGAAPAGTVNMLERHKKVILASLNKGMTLKEVREDNDFINKMNEVKDLIGKMKLEASTEVIEQMMSFHDLRREIES